MTEEIKLYQGEDGLLHPLNMYKAKCPTCDKLHPTTVVLENFCTTTLDEFKKTEKLYIKENRGIASRLFDYTFDIPLNTRVYFTIAMTPYIATIFSPTMIKNWVNSSVLNTVIFSFVCLFPIFLQMILCHLKKIESNKLGDEFKSKNPQYTNMLTRAKNIEGVN